MRQQEEEQFKSQILEEVSNRARIAQLKAQLDQCIKEESKSSDQLNDSRSFLSQRIVGNGTIEEEQEEEAS